MTKLKRSKLLDHFCLIINSIVWIDLDLHGIFGEVPKSLLKKNKFVKFRSEIWLMQIPNLTDWKIDSALKLLLKNKRTKIWSKIYRKINQKQPRVLILLLIDKENFISCLSNDSSFKPGEKELNESGIYFWIVKRLQLKAWKHKHFRKSKNLTKFLKKEILWNIS